MGGVFAPVTLIALGTLEDRDIADGSTLVNVARLVAGSLGSAYATTIMTSRTSAFFEAMTANLTAGSARVTELAARFAQLAGGSPGTTFDPTAWTLFLATNRGLILRRAAGYAYHATYQHLGLFSLAAALAVLLIRARIRKIDGPIH